MQQQFSTYQTRLNISRNVNPVKLEPYQRAFLLDCFRKAQGKIILLVSLLFIQVVMEIAVLVLVRGSIREQAFNAFHRGELVLILGLLSLGIVVYLLISYFALKIERQTVLAFINKLRRNWFLLILGRAESAMTSERKAAFIAKASYHFPLISLGIDNSALGAIRWALCACILLILGSTGKIYLMIGSVTIVALSLLSGIAAYFVSKYYVSQEVASYSKVIRHIDSSLSEFSFIKAFKQERAALKGLDARVDTDTYFRIRRDIWLRYFRKIIYTFFFIAAIGLVVLNIYHPEIFAQLSFSNQNFSTGIISLYALRLFFESVRTGLYVPPLMLGLALSIPERIPRDSGENEEKHWSRLEFRSNKTKLYNEGKYYKNIALLFETGKRYLLIGEPRQGKTSLAELFAGKARFNKNGWLVKIDDVRLDYRHWVNLNSGSFFLSSYFHSDRTVGEVIFGKEKQLITAEDLFSVYPWAEKHPLLAMVVSKKRFVGESLRQFEANSPMLFAIYTLHCLICKPRLILIDNQWLDLNYPEINSLTTILHQGLPESAIVAFSRNNNNIIPYNKKYEIKTDHIQDLQDKTLPI
jgi:hypothetical protein